MPVLGAFRDATLESQTLFNLAVEKVKRSNYREALQDLIEALKIAPANPSYRSYFGVCLAHVEEDFDRALRFCRSATEARPLDPMLHVNLGRVYKLSGNNATAHKEFVRAWEVCRGHPAAAAELTRMGIRRPPFFHFLPRSHWINKYLGVVRAALERRILGRRMH